MTKTKQPAHLPYLRVSAPCSRIRLSLALLCAACLLALPARAQPLPAGAWTGGGPDQNFTDTANWVGGYVPGQLYQITFGSAVVAGTMSIDIFNIKGDIILSNSLTQNITINNGGQPLLKQAAPGSGVLGVIDMSSAAADLAINADYWFWADETWNIGPGRTLTVNGFLYDSAFSPRACGIIKTGPGTAIINNSGLYNGTTTISGGVLQIGNGGSTGTLGTSNVVDNASLVFNRSSTAVTNLISGTGSVTLNYNSILELQTTNTYSGGTYVNFGMLRLDAPNSTAGSGPVTVASGAACTIWASSAMTLGNSFVLNSMGIDPTAAAINQDGGPGLVTLNGNITLAGDSRIGVGGLSWNSMIINGRISGPGKLYVHESLANATTLTLANGANNWTGGTEVESGELHLTATGALGSGLVTVDTGAILSGSGTIAGPVTVASDSLLQPGQGGTDSSALTINNTLSLSGTTLIAINRTNASNASTLTGISTLTRGGTLTVINVGPDPQVGDSFALFRASSFTGTFSTTDLPSLVGILFWTLNNGTLSVSATPSAPIVITEPVGGTRYVGGTFTFTPLLQGYPVPHWQWKHNASNITGATNLTLTLTNLQASDAGNYILYATNSLGFTNTATATLSVLTASGYAAAVLANNPMGYWRFSEGGGTYALDYISGNDAVDPLGSPLQAGPQPTAFPGFESTNTAPFMDGMSQGYATTVPLFNNLSNFTIMGWFNIDPNQYPFVPDPFYHPDGRASLFGLEWAAELGFYQGNQLYFFGTGIDHTIFVTNGFAAGQWNFVAAVSDAVAHTTTLYLNGVAAGTASACPGTVQPWVFSIGKNVAYYPESGYDNAFFPGSLDEVAAFSHALPASAIQALYQAALRFKINIMPQAGGLQVSWPVGHLESASSPTGHWATVTGAVSPLSVTPTDARKFYRAVSP